MFDSLEKADSRLQKDVREELKMDPSINSDQIKVTCDGGIVTLRGTVPHFFEKGTAEKSALHVGGARAVADEIEVKIVDSSDRSDEDIARAALMALNWTYQTPEGIKVIVKNGWITLSGDAQWEFERAAAKQSVSTLIGVKGVTNEITLKLKVMQFDVKRRVKDALKRSAENEGQNITVKVSDNRVTLSGTVHSLTGVEDARVAAWNGPGIMSVENNLKVAQ